LSGLYRDMADRLAAIGEVDLGLMTRRRLIDLLRGLTGRLGDLARLQLASALTDLAHNLVEYGRVEEADAAAAEAAGIEQSVERTLAPLEEPARERVGRGTQPVMWTPLPPTAAYAATTATSGRRADLAILHEERQREAAAWLQAERAEAPRQEVKRMELARIEAQQREAERVEAERAVAARLAAERAQADEAERLEAARRAAADEAERLERKRRRQERMEAHRLEVERREAERREGERREAERLAAVDPAEAERLELERLQAEIDELERAEKRAQADRNERG
jgi:chemosensory pili system protein ChpA (sensor histidine kinase/response regulator)